MPCYAPKVAVRVHENHETFWTSSGKSKIWFGRAAQSLMQHPNHEILNIPCGQCIGCRNRIASDWAIRCYHESMFWTRASFITLTYASPWLPENRSLVKSDLQKFWKRVRIWLDRNRFGMPIKYFACGEYGEEKGRPHYHAVVFGWDFDVDISLHGTKQNPWAAHPLYEPPLLEELWGMGKCTLGISVTGACAAYVAKYALKKAYGSAGRKEYADTKRVPPFIASSQGIGDRWFDKYKSDLYPSDFVVNEDGSKRLPVPRRYDRLLGAISEEYLEWIKTKRVAKRKFNPADETLERMAVREMVAKAASKAASERRMERKISAREKEASQNASGTNSAICTTERAVTNVRVGNEIAQNQVSPLGRSHELYAARKRR